MRLFQTDRGCGAPGRAPRRYTLRAVALTCVVALLAVLFVRPTISFGSETTVTPSAAPGSVAATSTVTATEVITPTVSPTAPAGGTPTSVAYLPAIEAAENASAPDIVGCTATNLKKGPILSLTGNNTQMKVTWQWTDNSTFTINWGTSTSYGKSGSVAPWDATNHIYAYTIVNLTPGTKYYYQVSASGKCANYSFYAPPSSSATNVKFVAYGDTRTNAAAHDGVAGQVNALWSGDPAFQTLNLDVGDWVSTDSESAWSSEFFSSSYSNIRKQDASIADTGVRGNHDGAGNYLKKYFPQPYQPGGLYRSFDYGPMHVVILDQYVALGAGSTQYNWLKNDLGASTKKWKFVVLHEPGWSSGGSHENNTTVQNDLQPLFKQYGVSIVFGGHNHYYARATVDGIQHLTVGGGGAPLVTPASGYPNIVAKNSSYGFAQFSIAGNTLTAKAVNSSGSTIDSFSITR